MLNRIMFHQQCLKKFSFFLPFFVAILGVTLGVIFMAGCGTGDFAKANRSVSGLLIEKAFPEDTWFLLSFNTLDETQRIQFDALKNRLSKNPEAFQDQFLQSVDANLESVNLSYLDDIQPILGEEGVRFVFGLSEGNGEKPVVHVGVTIRDVEQANALLMSMEREGRFLKKVVNGHDFYFNAMTDASTQDLFYFSIFEDLLLISNGEDELLQMLNLIRSEKATSLWTNENYLKVVRRLPEAHVATLFLDGERFSERMNALDPGRLANSFMRYLKGQGLAILAEEDRFVLRGYAQANRKKLKADKVDLGKLSAKSGYLYREMPSEDLAVYLESYDFSEVLKNQFDAEPSVDPASGQLGQTPLFSLKSILGADQFKFEEFLNKGYGVGVYRTLGFLPKITLFFDVSDDVEQAQNFVTFMDTKLSNLITFFKFQAGTLSDALSKETLSVEDGVDFQVVRLKTALLLNIYDPQGLYPIPDALKNQDVVLIYGVTKDQRLLVSMDEHWLEPSQIAHFLDEDVLYQETFQHLQGFDRGIVYVATQALRRYLEDFHKMRETLATAADVPLPVAEGDPSSSPVPQLTSPVLNELPPEASMDFADLLQPLKSFGFSSDFGWYDVEVGGVLLVE